MKRLFFVSLIVLSPVLLLAFGLGGNPRVVPSPLATKPAPDFTLALFTGSQITLAELRGWSSGAGRETRPPAPSKWIRSAWRASAEKWNDGRKRSIMLVLILIVGALALLAIALAFWPFLLRQPSQPAPAYPLEARRRLSQELEAHYRALGELDEDLATGKLSAEDHSRLKEEIGRAAAALLARLEALPQARPAPAPSQEGRRSPAVEPGRDRLLARPPVVAGGAAFLLLAGLGLGLLIPRFFMSPPSPPSATPAADPLAGLERKLAASPTDLKKLLAFGPLALDAGQPSKAIQAYTKALELEPKNVEALTHVGLLLHERGHTDQALAHLDRALEMDPTYAHALWDKASLLYHTKQDYPGAIKALEAFLALIPQGEDADRARAMIAEAKGRALLSPPRAGAGRR